MRHWRLIMLVLAVFLVVAVAGPGIALAEEGDDDDYTQDHEACGMTTKFDYDSGSDTLEWGGTVLCTPAVFYISMSVELQYRVPWSGAWVIVDWREKICFDSVCKAEDLEYNPTWGDYRQQGCFLATSPTSDWEWECWHWNDTIP